MKGDPGYFGPNSMMWKVNKEITVLFGGARALLMHAAHPLIAAGARQTSFYQRDPWKRLIRTLSLQNSVTFGTIEEANESATRINKLHEVIKGKDEITGKTYDALEHEQLLWVHACLQVSSIYFYELTVKKLTEDEKNQYHTENIKSAQLVLVNKDCWTDIYLPNERTESKITIDPVDLKNSPDFTLLYGINTNDCDIKINYDDNRRKGRSWTISLPYNNFVMFPSTNTYSIINKQKESLNFIQTITYDYI